jgi:hypothetical protein
MINQSQKKAMTIVIVTVSILVLLPLTIFITSLLLNKPKLAKETQKPNTQTGKQDDLKGSINQGITVEYLKPDKTWNHKIINTQTNPSDKLISQEVEITNGISTMNITLVEVDNRYLKYATGNPNYTLNPLNTSLYGYVEKPDKGVTEFNLIPTKRYYRIPNIRLGSGMIFIDPAIAKDKLYQSSMLLFPDYQLNKKSQELQVQITYNQDSDQNYAILDRIFKSLRYKPNE